MALGAPAVDAPDTWKFTVTTFRVTVVLMLLARSAYFSVFIVSSNDALLGAMLAIITVPGQHIRTHTYIHSQGSGGVRGGEV